MTDADQTPEPTGTLTGAQVAVLAWDLPADAVAGLLAPGASDADVQDVRAQFALWATAMHGAPLGTLAQAWNRFAAPAGPHGQPAVRLPGSACQRCRSRRMNAADLSTAGYPHCPECRGTGRKPPRAVPAALAAEAPGEGPAPAG